MQPSRKYIDHTADILFEAKASSLGELFEQCGLAVEESQVDLSNFGTEEKIVITLERKKVDDLLFDFLDELLLYKDSDLLLFSKFECNVEEKDGLFKLTCNAFGEKLDREKHEQRVDVKAITMHMFEVKEIDGGWKATVLIDI